MMMNKRCRAALAALLAGALALAAVPMAGALTPLAETGAPFTDVHDSWAREEIEALYSQGIYEGMIFRGDGAFYPEAAITRAEFLLMLFNAMGLDLSARDTARTAPFEDYEQTPSAYRPYVAEGYSRGIVLGKANPDGTLYSGWDDTLQRQEAVTFIGRILNARSEADLTFTDSAEVALWARDYLAAQTGAGIVTGMPDGSFAPHRSLSRAEAARMVYNLLAQQRFVPTEIRVYAGSTGLGIDNGPRLSASFGTPYGLIVARDGALMVADREANLLRRITGEAVELLAGQTELLDINGLPQGGYRDNTASTDIMLSGPRYLVQSAGGSIYYTDGGNNAVRVITADGKAFTFSGIGTAGYTNGTREESAFNLPSGLDFDPSGNLYVADTLNNCIRIIRPDGSTALFAGVPGEAGGYRDGGLDEALFCQPTDLQFGPDGALYLCDTGNSMIRVIRDGQVSTLAGSATGRDDLSGAMAGGYADGTAEESLLCGPLGLYVTRGGAVLVADTENNVIRKIEGGRVTTVAGNTKAGNSTGPALVSMLNAPVDVLVVDNAIYVSDSNNHCIKVFGAGLGE